VVVDNLKRKEFILPIGLGILFALLYYKLPLKYFVCLFLGVIVAIATLYDVKFGVCASVFVLPYMPDMLNLLFMLFVFCAFVYDQIFRESNKLETDSIDMPIALFVILIVISTITSVNPSGSFRDLAIHLISLAFVFVVVNSIKDKKDLNVLLTFMVFTATIVALYGFYQYKVGVEMEDKWVDATNNPGLTARVFSVFGNPNICAEYLIMTIPIAFALFWNTKKLSKKIIFLLSSLALTAALLLTYSRGGWVGFAFGLFMFVLLVEKRLFLLLIPLTIIALNFLPPSIVNRIMSIGNLGDSSNSYRIRIWKIVLDIIKDYWVAGVGFGYIPFKQVYETYIRTMPAYHAHNMYLETLAEMGVPGFISLIIFIFILYKYSIKTFKKCDDKYIKVMAGGVLSGLSAVFFHGLVENVLYLPKIIITFWTLVSFILVLKNISKEHEEIS
jgi:putative inorganic carbon (HCO3(-)) transporter